MNRHYLAATAALAIGFASTAVAQEDANAPAAVDLADSASDSATETASEADAVTPVAVVEAKKITDRTHPDYIRCRSEKVIGSLAKRRKRCMTNREWRMVSEEGNKRANDFVEEHRATSLANN